MPKKLKLNTPLTQPHADGSSNTLDEAWLDGLYLSPATKILSSNFFLIESSSGARAEAGRDVRAWKDLPADVKADYANLVESVLKMLSGGTIPAGAVEDL